MRYILRGRDSEGNPMFYTGRAGMNWMSHYEYEAFEFATHEAANWKAKHFNKFYTVHDYWFIVRQVAEVA